MPRPTAMRLRACGSGWAERLKRRMSKPCFRGSNGRMPSPKVNWALLPEPCAPNITVPAWPQFMRGCIQYRQSLDVQAKDAPRNQDEFPS